jgi:hypothetical protein
MDDKLTTLEPGGNPHKITSVVTSSSFSRKFTLGYIQFNPPNDGHKPSNIVVGLTMIIWPYGDRGWTRRHSSSLTIKMTIANDPDALEATNYGATQNQILTDTETPTRIRPGTHEMYQKLCPNCREWVGLGRKGNPYPFILHRDGERCRRVAELKALAQADEVPASLVASTSFRPEPIPTFSTPPISTYPHIPISEPTFDCSPFSMSRSSLSPPIFPHLDVPMVDASSSSLPLPPLIFPERTSYTLPAIPDTMGPNALQVSPSPPGITTSLPPIAPLLEQVPPITSYPRFLTTTKVPCHGVRLKWEHGHSSRTYPFQYHDTDNLTWSVTTQRPPDIDVIYLQSFSCTLFHDAGMEACFECLKVPSSDKFQSLVLKASKDPAPTLPWGYLSWEQISKRLRDRTDECRRYRKKVSSTLSAASSMLIV